MSSIPFLVIGIIIGAVLGYVGAVAQRGSTIQQNADQITALRAEVAQWQARTQSAEAAAARENAIVAALSPIRTQLEQMGVRVETMERQRADQHNARPHNAESSPSSCGPQPGVRPTSPR